MILVDTDIWIDFFSGAEPGAQAVEALLTQRRAALSVITVFELFCGATTPGQVEQLERLISAVHPIALTHEAARRAAAFYVHLKRRGQLIGNQDLMLAATAMELGTAVVTRNLSHFERIDGLEILSPQQVLSA